MYRELIHDIPQQGQRSRPGCTTVDSIRQYDLFITDIGTKFKPQEIFWSDKLPVRRCNTTYLPKHVERHPTKLDYYQK